MLVYGDHNEIADPQERLSALPQPIDAVAQMPPGLERHAALVAILIEAGQLLQGVADAEFTASGEDQHSTNTDELSVFLLELAKAVACSWDSAFERSTRIPSSPALEGLPSEVELRTPEGFAFYAVYPEAYVAAARRLALLAPPCVIGIRSIGTTLAATVAAALDSPAPLTVRPHGDPFARQLTLSRQLERELLDGERHYVIVDEGPGLSGSSFGAVADWLQDRGVPLERIAFVPSHDGAPGPQASDAHRQRWAVAQRVPALFDDLPRLLRNWISPLVGETDGPLIDISGGAWRNWRYSSEEQWPVIDAAWERRKFLAGARGERFLIKFAGLGAIGERKLGMARALHSAGLVPEPIGLAHGFLVERWRDDAPPLGPGDKPFAQIARYIAARARLFPAPEPGLGASPADLFQMCRRNITLAPGEEPARLVDRWEPALDRLARRVVRVRTDNRMLPHEWLNSSAGLLKTDALDHHAGHDLIGSQDMAWDVAGAIVEFELDARDSAELIASVEQMSGRHVESALLDFYRLAYLAFRVGQTAMSAERGSAGEGVQLRQDSIRYCRAFEDHLQSSFTATRPTSLVG